MYRLLTLLFCFALFQGAVSLSDVELDCIKTYNNTLSNDYLLGEWRAIYLFGLFISPVPSLSCIDTTFSEFTAEELAEYTNHYTDTSKPYDFSDRPIKYDEHRGYYKGAVMGSNEVKYMVYSPTSNLAFVKGYQAQAFRKVNDDFMLYINCELRSQRIWLYSRGSEIPSIATLNAVIAGIPEVKSFNSQRYCA